MIRKWHLLYRQWDKVASYVPSVSGDYREQIVEITEFEGDVRNIDPHSTPGFVRVSYVGGSIALIPFGQVLRVVRQ